MGIDKNGVRFILYAKKKGADFARSATIGRQGFYVERKHLAEVLKRYGYGKSDEAALRILAESGGFSESFLKFIGADQIESFDNSDYEGATRVHDFNTPLPEKYEQRFSAVIDAGSLEHIFNFPVAINNCMNMVEPGGHFISITPANNFCGHGFYQFSPEVFFSLFRPENGFQTAEILCYEDASEDSWYHVSNPRDVNSRVMIKNYFPLYLLVFAKRISGKHIPLSIVQQRDYKTLWEGRALDDSESRKVSQGAGSLARKVLRILPEGLRDRIKRILFPVPFVPPFFRPFGE